ncbi:hypothetical protein RINTHM_9110 [Richelia intracellularis HM01]|nr:hypothetical protein RINTHM_9110 [Richelia intracellularis HM01]
MPEGLPLEIANYASSRGNLLLGYLWINILCLRIDINKNWFYAHKTNRFRNFYLGLIKTII